MDYGINIWGDNNFYIKGSKVFVSDFDIALVDIVNLLRKKNYTGPLLLRFPHLIEKQINKLFNSFNNSIKEYNYNGSFNAVFPLKVNQLPNFIMPLLEYGKKYNYGLEAGSKAELIIALAYNDLNSPITVNGFKDKQIIKLGFIASYIGYNITIIIEGLNELEMIIEASKILKMPIPNIGIRVKLHNDGIGIWAKSGGINSKFGLSSTEILQAYDLLKENNLLDKLTMIHFHIGSALNKISPLKKALKESGHIYAELKNLGAVNLNNINIGGGLAIEYSSYYKSIEYSLEEFANDVIFTLKNIAKQKNVNEPNIFTESGRFISAPSTILVAPVLELYSNEVTKNFRLKDKNPPLIEELYSLYCDINKKTAIEYMHDSLEHLESILTLFDLGYVDLTDRSNAEVLTGLIIKKALNLIDVNRYEELKKIESKIQEKYLINMSIFQSLPDFWGIGQEFPIMPLTHLDKKPTRSATLWDITCDSDGEISFNEKKPLYLHDINLDEEDYFIGFFNVGAYQDILGMRHNLFSHPTEVNILYENNEIKFDRLLEAQNISDILEDIDYDIKDIKRRLKEKVSNMDIYDILLSYINSNSYLITKGFDIDLDKDI